MTKTILNFFLLFSCSLLFAQKEANNWYFGENAGLNFNGNTTALTNGSINTTEGCASFSDAEGNLLFYTDGMTVWNKNHAPMPNGLNLAGDSSSTQSSIVIPKPGEDGKYYLFTVGSSENSTGGFYYYELNMNLNGGLGDISSGPVNLSGALGTTWTEKITAIQSAECDSYWVISLVNNTYYAFKISSTGVDTPIISTVPYTAIDGRGYLKVSPDGSKLAAAHFHDNNGDDSKFFLYNFDNSTGVVSNSETLLFDDPANNEHPYGVEFSSNSERLYLSTFNESDDTNKIYQYNLLSSNIANSQLLINSKSGFRGALQLGPNGRIYVTVPVSYSVGSSFLDVIEAPNNLGIACGYLNNEINLGTGKAKQGLPPFIQSIILSKAEFIDIPEDVSVIELCDNETYTIKVKSYPNASYTWKFISATGSENFIPTPVPQNQLEINQFSSNLDGTYEVTVTFLDGNCPKEGKIEINFSDIPALQPISNWHECSLTGNGFFDFDLVANTTPNVLNGDSASDYEVTYYNSESNAENKTNALSNPYTNQAAFTAETIWVRKENISTECYSIESFSINVINLNINASVATLHNCDFDGVATESDNNDGFAEFNLKDNEVNILNGEDPADFDIKYFTDATFTNEILDPTAFTNTVFTLQTIYFQVNSILNTSCNTNGEFLISVDPNPVFSSTFTTTSLEECADDVSNNTTFDISGLSDVFQNSPDYSYTFYLNGTALPSTQDLTAVTINSNGYVEVMAESSLGCQSKSDQIQLIINEMPPLVTVDPLEECDLDLDGLISWDLTTLTTELTSNNLYIITYHTTQASAEGSNSDVILTPNSFNSASTTVFYRITNPTTNCFNIGSFEVILDAFPTVPAEFTFEQCDDIVHDGIKSFYLPDFNSEILASMTDVSILGYYLSPDDIENPAVGPLPDNYTTGDTTLYVHLNDDIHGCTTYTEIHLVVLNIPNVNENAPNIVACDDDFDGQTLFNLTENQGDLIDLTAFTNPMFEYYTDASLSDAYKIPVGEITSYENIYSPLNTQEIWVKVSTDNQNCFGSTSFFLVVNPKPIINPIENLKECTDEDGYVNFDLTLAEAGLMNGQNGLTIAYYHTYLEATGETNEITNPTTFQNNQIPVQEIFYTLTNTTTGCKTVASFNIEVLENPTIPAEATVEVCDDLVADGIITVDLNDYNEFYQQGNANYLISYFETSDFATNNINALNTDYTNTSSPYNYEIFVRIENTDTSCVSITKFTTNILNIPNPGTPEPIYSCATGNNGFSVFDFSHVETEIITALGNVNVSFYLTEINALNSVNPLTDLDNHSNLSPNQEIIYIRVEDVTTGCFNIVELVLNVEDNPELTTPTDIELCDEGSDGVEDFNLTIKEGEITTDPNFTFQYFIDDASAVNNNGIGEIVNPTFFTNTSNPQTVTVRVNNPTNGCYSLTSLTLKLNDLPSITQPTPYEFCDDEADGDISNGIIQNIILQNKDAEILNGSSGIVSYHETEDGPAIDKSAPYTNLSPTQALFVKVTNIETGCEATVILDLIVHTLPNINDLLVIEECDDDYDGHTFFNLDDVKALYDPAGIYEINFYETQENAEENDTALAVEANYYSVVNNIFVNITNATSNCSLVKELTLVVNPIPEMVEVEDMETCEGDNSFNFEDIYNQIVNGQTDITVKFFNNIDDANNDVGSIDISAPYTNNSNPETIYVRIEYIATGCYTLTTFDLIINPNPLVGDNLSYEICDDDYDGFAMFDLNTMDDDALVGQLGVLVEYYMTEAQALDPNSIPLADNFVNTVQDAQDIYVKLVNVSTGCYTLTTLTLVVEPLPEPNYTPTPLEECDEDGNGTEAFDLTDAIADVTNNAANYEVKFYPNLTDAENNENEIVDVENFESASTTITVKVINSNTTQLCEVFVSLDLILNDPLEITIPSPIVFCDTDEDGIVSKSMDELNSIIFESLENLTITYHVSEQDARDEINQIVTDYDISTSTVLYIRVEEENSVCAFIAPVNFIVDISPEYTANLDPYTVCGEEGIGTFQLNDVMTPLITSNPDAVVTYYESEEDATNSENAVDGVDYISENGTVWVNISNPSTGCDAITSFELVVENAPTFDVSDLVVYCIDDLDFFIEAENPGGEYTYEWSDFDGNVFAGETTSTLHVTEEGVYAVKAFTTDGTIICESEIKYILVEKSELPKITIDDITITDYLTNEGTNFIQIDIANIGIGEYEFSIDEGTTWQSEPYFSDVRAGAYQLLIRDVRENGCGEIAIDISVVGYPSYFTPNGDGIHDYWNIHGIENYPEAKIYIFDRFGKSIHKIDPTTEGWDGKKHGQELPSSGYWFTMELVDNNGNRVVRKGHFNLKR
ncbi:T9SS type B sorting domain-containing protein [Aureivirga sp. CE67]|uniref:T9SS type B sorting domain-containing protein n=1 Tax=Aureivirga sp. CE67 TaxID=1788983 RepID=UPI0018CBEA3C|nr:T9SS type B sorting domain-containing protein [Aureivirga sp. CE67]